LLNRHVSWQFHGERVTLIKVQLEWLSDLDGGGTF
jgi:hypothetical protein